MIERQLLTATHGRYLVRAPDDHTSPAPILAGFHGYGENADVHLNRLVGIPGAARWRVVSIQGLHRFYRMRSDDVVASWMTRQDRELAIADNIIYVSAVLAAVAAEWPTRPPVVFAGFSQGVSMAFRAAVGASQPAAVIAAGGDVPPEIAPEALGRLSSVLLCRGASDGAYRAAQFAADVDRLEHSGVRVRALEFAGGHEWSSEVNEAAGALLTSSY